MAGQQEQLDVVGLTKRFGDTVALDDLTFSVTPGSVTGFLGPNGSGKTTTLRCLLGLVRPTAGSATIGGRSYRDLPRPLSVVGSALEASDFHPGRSARDHLTVVALAAGIAWLRGFLQAFAADGRTVLVSSHMLSEVQQTVDEVVVINRGRLVRQGRLADLDAGPAAVLVRTPNPEGLRDALPGVPVETLPLGVLRVTGPTAEQVGRTAFEAGVELHELTPEAGDLERLFLHLTGEGGEP